MAMLTLDQCVDTISNPPSLSRQTACLLVWCHFNCKKCSCLWKTNCPYHWTKLNPWLNLQTSFADAPAQSVTEAQHQEIALGTETDIHHLPDSVIGSLIFCLEVIGNIPKNQAWEKTRPLAAAEKKQDRFFPLMSGLQARKVLQTLRAWVPKPM